MKSQASFRWVILKTPNDATELLYRILGTHIDWSQWNKGEKEVIFGFPAWLAGHTFVASDQVSVNNLLTQRLEDRGISYVCITDNQRDNWGKFETDNL